MIGNDTAPSAATEDDARGQEPATNDAEDRRLAELKAKLEAATPDEALPEAQSEQSQA